MARVLVAVAALLSFTLGLGMFGVGEAGAADFHTCPAKGADQVRVAIVVDARALGGSQSVVCVVVASGANGLTALRARATRIGTSPPRIGTTGLVCAIDGVPVAPACGGSGPNGPEYWSYWLGGSSWTYAPVGPATRTVSDGTVDGWRFLKGGGNVAPDASPDFATLTAPK